MLTFRTQTGTCSGDLILKKLLCELNNVVPVVLIDMARGQK